MISPKAQYVVVTSVALALSQEKTANEPVCGQPASEFKFVATGFRRS